MGTLLEFWNKCQVDPRRHLLQMTDSERCLKCQSDVKSEVRILHHLMTLKDAYPEQL